MSSAEGSGGRPLPPELQDDPLATGLWPGFAGPPSADDQGATAEVKLAQQPSPAFEPDTEPKFDKPVSHKLEHADDDATTSQQSDFGEPVALPQALVRPASEQTATAVAPIRLDAGNTRHLAWMLGAKATVVALADLAGIEAARDSQWEVDKLAELLDVARPNDPDALAGSTSASDAVSRLISQSRVCADQLTDHHGADHAALMEIALKSNALLALYETQPGLALPVRRAIENADTRSALPPGTLAPLLDQLDGAATPAAVRDAVHATHRAVEQLLRGGG